MSEFRTLIKRISDLSDLPGIKNDSGYNSIEYEKSVKSENIS